MAAKAKPPGAPPPRMRPWLVYAAVTSMLAWYFITSVSAVADKSTTFDELFHLTSGYSYWKFGDFRLQPENGNLPQRWAAIPLLFTNTRFPDLDQDAWRQSAVSEIGEQFFYGIGNDVDAMLFRGRAMIALFGVSLGALIFFWTRSLLGLAPAFLSLGLYSFCPTMLANGALVTSDTAAALFFAASTLCIWRVVHRVNWQTLLVGSLVMGGLFVSKFSAFMLLPIGLILMAIQLVSGRPTMITFGRKTWEVQRPRRRLMIHLVTVAVHAIVVWIVIWAFYNFRYDMFATNTRQHNPAGEMVVGDQPLVPWSELLQKPGAVEAFIEGARDTHFLPEAYLYGFAYTWQSAQQRRAFLNGNYSIYGWPQFFPYCLLVKTPLTLFVLMGLAALAVIRAWFGVGKTSEARSKAILGSLYRRAPLWTLFAVYWAFAIPSHLNIGHRHILPTYPPMLMFAGGAWAWLAKRPRVAATLRHSHPDRAGDDWRATRWLATRRWPIMASLVLLTGGAFAAESLWRWPNYLAYFNQLAGGPWQGYRHLVDSSLDWGQDLPALKHWLVTQQLNGSSTEKTYLSYFGTGDPRYYGIEVTLLPCFFPRPSQRVPEPLEAGTYCISASMLQNVYTMFPGRWNRKYEAEYQQVDSKMRTFYSMSPKEREQLVAGAGHDSSIEAFRLYEDARLARLTSFLRQREPDFEINFSILVYRLQKSDLNRALEGPPVEIEEEAFVSD